MRRRYDAFVSYSHAADSRLAPALRLGLERLAKPWYRRRGLSVYLDSSGLEVTPALWRTISAALADSRYLVLLCSPGAAASPWVGREIEFWLSHRSVETILPVVTDGDWVWDEASGRLDPELSTAAPPALHEAFAESPRYLDLRWARSRADVDLRNPRFRDGLAQLAAPLSGREKSEIEGEDVQQHRRTVRTAWSAAAALAVLLVASLIATVVATVNGERAARERDVATSRLLAAQSAARENSDPQLATLLALTAANIGDTDEARSATLRMAEYDKRIQGFLGGHAGIVETAAFSPDGRTLATAGPDDPVRLWDVASRTVVAELGASVVPSVVFSPDGGLLFAAQEDRITAWDVATRQVRAELPGDFFSISVSGDGSRLVSGTSTGEVAVWDIAAGRQVARLAGLQGQVSGVALSPDGRLAAAGDWNGTTQVWDVASGTSLTSTDGYAAATKGRAAFSGDGRTLAISGESGVIQLLDVPTLTWSSVQHQYRTVQGLRFTDDRTLVSASIDGLVVTLALDTGNAVAYTTSPLTATTGTVLSPDGRTAVSGNFDGVAVLWTLDGDWSSPVGTLTSGLTAATDPTGAVAAIDGTGSVVEVTTPAGTQQLTPPAMATTVTMASDGRPAVGLLDGRVVLLDPATGAVVGTFATTTGAPVVSVDFSPATGLLAAATYEGAVTVWTVADGTVYADIPSPVAEMPFAAINYTHVAFSPDGTTLAHSWLPGLALWDVPTRSRRAVLDGPSDIGTASLAFDGTGALLAQGGVDSTVVLWDPARPQESVGVLSAGPGAAVVGLSFGPDGVLAAGTTSGAGTTLWDVARRAPQATLRSGTGTTVPEFVPDGSALLVTDPTGVHRYDLAEHTWRERLCGLVGRDLTAAEWNAYVEGREQQPVCRN